MAANSWYKSFAELSQSEREGLDYSRMVSKRKSGIAVIAPHGGGIEPGTSEIAKAIAGRVFSCYTFDGLKQSANELLHITSTSFDEPQCLHLLESSQIVVAVHGCVGKDDVIYIGGLHDSLKAQLIQALRKAGFDAREAIANYSGNQPQNLCNRGQSGQGIQMEITDGLRRTMFKGLSRQDRKITTPVFRKFALAVRKTLLSAVKEMGLEHGLFYYLH
jgi:phage replication-related protein YjqB (UPF0714/DUF867 family)